MKLKSLYIRKYKNLSGTYNFENCNAYIALIGLNGSGKSNILEVISIIFKIITGLCPENSIGDFSLSYEIDGRVYYAEYWKRNGNLFINNTLRKPSSIISCYSGEDDRLWKLGYKDYYVKFFNAAIAGGDYKPTNLYINKYCWKIAFISLLFSENDEVKRFITDKLKVNHNTITIQFKTKKRVNPQPHDASNWYKRVVTKFRGAEISIDELINNEDVELLCTKYPDLTNDQIIFYYLYFLSIPDKRNTIGLEADKIIESIDIKLNGYNFVDLSEGEKKLILIECITKVLGDENSLILLDEPDAHTHIAMKKKILKLISEFKGQTVLTSHSPVFVDIMLFKNLLYLENGKPLDMDRIQAINDISDRQINVLDSALISSAKKIVVAEGPGDVIHLEKAIEKLSNTQKKYEPLTNDIAIMFQGGAKMVDEYYHSVLSGNLNHLEKVVFVFDHDGQGREGAKLVEKLGDDKIDYLFYERIYPITSTEKDFYLEDFYPSSFYSEIRLPQIEGKPLYCQMKKMDSLASSVKKKIAKKIKDENIDVLNFEGYTNFLDQLLIKFGYNNE